MRRGSAALQSRKEDLLQRALEGDSVFAWDEASQRVVYVIWGSDGSHRQLEVRRERPRGEGWATELTVTYRRAAPPAAASTRP